VIFMWNLFLKSAHCTPEREISSLAEFNTRQQRNTTDWTRKSLQVPRDSGQWRYTSSTIEGKIGEGIHR